MKIDNSKNLLKNVKFDIKNKFRFENEDIKSCLETSLIDDQI